MDEKFGLLLLGNIAGFGNCLALGGERVGRLGCTRAPYTPL
jgi:hypothetical protein